MCKMGLPRAQYGDFFRPGGKTPVTAVSPIMENTYRWDVFISYSRKDEGWVHGELWPVLEGSGIRVRIDDQDFDVGVPQIINKERAFRGQSAHVDRAHALVDRE